MESLSPEDWARLRDLLTQALDLPAPERASYLDAHCADAPALRAEVDALLEAEAEAGSFLEAPVHAYAGAFVDALEADALEADAPPAPDLVGQRIGSYRLVKRLGRGGMGSVFLAQRDDDQYRRLVAVKLIRRGMDTDDILRRFRNERQILAALDHPHIARLLEGGMTDEGLPYFVMEYIDGVPIGQYCDRHCLPVARRLALFLDVCEAVQYAHQNLVVHRDLKPSNILITQDGQVKLLDFGIAKVLNPVLAALSVAVTRTEMRVMTPEYASPEQVLGQTITTASDVYALGVLLYELLTGHRPYHLKSRVQTELVRAIVEEKPTRPSTVVSQVRELETRAGTTTTITPEHVSAARSTELVHLKRRLRGDLDNIVMKALRKEPKRRYATAEQLGADVQRFLEGVPILARKATTGYRLAKFVQRHRMGVAAAVVTVLALFGGLGAALWQARVAAAERDVARREAQKAEQIAEFMVGVFEIANPTEALGDTVTARELLDQGAARIDEDLHDQPAVQATMMQVMGRAYRSIGLYETSQSLLEQALEKQQTLYGPETPHPDVAKSLHELGQLMYARAKNEETEQNFRAALAMRRQLYGNQHPDLVPSLFGLADVLRRRDEHEEATRVMQEALVLQRTFFGPEDPIVARSLIQLGMIAHDQEKLVEAESYYREALAIRRRRYARPNEEVTESLNNLAVVLRQQGRFDEAIPLYHEALDIRLQIYGPEHERVANIKNNLGVLLMSLYRLEDADALLRDALAIRVKVFGRGHYTVASSYNNVGFLLYRMGRYEEAEEYFGEAIAIRREIYGPTTTGVASYMNNLGRMLGLKGDTRQAERLMRQALPLMIERSKTEVDNDVARIQHSLGDLLRREGRYAEADTLLNTALRNRRALLDASHPEIGQNVLAVALLRLDEGNRAAADAGLQDALTILREAYPDGHPSLAETLLGLAQIRLDEGQPGEAETLIEEALAMQQRLLPEGHWQIARAQRYLGACRRAQRRPADARTLLQASLATLTARLGPRHAETQQTRALLDSL